MGSLDRLGGGRASLPSSLDRLTPYSLPDDVGEEERLRKRRERNKEAAARCREKRRTQEAALGRREGELEEEGRRLGEEVARLGEERRHLVTMLALHTQLYRGRGARTV